MDNRVKTPESGKKSVRENAGVNSADWIAEVSHELRLPIANIKLLIETLLNGALEDPATAVRMLNKAQGEVDRLQTLVSDLLSIEQLAQARNELQAEWLLLEPKAAYAVETTSAFAKEGSVRVELAVEPDFKVFANAEQIRQVLLNLVENAIKFTPAGGVVTIRSGQRPGVFAVEDSGIGIPPAEIPKIFQRFYRVDRARTRGSTGLGLSIVKNIVDLHGAKINVTSQEGKGSTFQLDFPGPRSGISGELDHG